MFQGTTPNQDCRQGKKQNPHFVETNSTSLFHFRGEFCTQLKIKENKTKVLKH